MSTLYSDIRYAMRALLARPGFSVLGVLTLAIGIGVNAVAFSAINGLLFKTRRFPNVETLGWLMYHSPGNPYSQISWPHYRDLAAASKTFESITASGRVPLSLHDEGRARQIWALFVSSNYFTTLRATPAIGRAFTSADLSGSELPVLVSERFWTEQLGGGSAIAGRTLVLNGRTVSVVGVMPDAFQGPSGLFEPDVYAPLDRMEVLNLPSRRTSRQEAWLGLVGRLAPGVTAAQAGAELQTIVSNLPAENEGVVNERRLTFTPMLDGHPEAQTLAPFMYVVLGVVSLVLLIACFNVAGLLLARASERQREISVRAALGASRARIVRQFTIEGVILAVVSGLAAMAIASWSASLLGVFSLPAPIPQRIHMQVDLRTIGFIAAMVAFAGVLPALLPAFQATRADLVRSMRQETTLGQQRSRTRNAFVIAQIAGSTLFMAAALLFVRSFWTTANTNPGFEVDHLLVMELEPANYGYDGPRARVLVDTLVDRLRVHPGVAHAAVGDRISFYVGFPKTTKVSADGADCSTADCRTVYTYSVGTDYLAALGAPLTAGRSFTERDVQAGDSVIVSRTLANHLWPGRNAVGEWIREGRDGRHVQVVGVVADVSHRALHEKPSDVLYKPLSAPEFGTALTVIVRTNAEARSFVTDAQDQLRALDASLPPSAIKTMQQRMELPLWPIRTASGFFLICGTLALTLATVGLFGMTYLAVSQRTREFGIRTALGATQARVLELVIGEGLWLAVPGIALGLVAAAIAGHLLASAVFNLRPADPSTYAIAAIVQLIVALVACLLPAYRATKVDPMLALRAQ
jgi:putative ABC transport system permease protein